MPLDLHHDAYPPRGTTLLLLHCALLDRLTACAGRPLEERLDGTLGRELARRLVAVLARGQTLGPRSLRGC